MKLIVVRQLSRMQGVTGLSSHFPDAMRMGIYANGEQSTTIYVQHTSTRLQPSSPPYDSIIIPDVERCIRNREESRQREAHRV